MKIDYEQPEEKLTLSFVEKIVANVANKCAIEGTVKIDMKKNE